MPFQKHFLIHSIIVLIIFFIVSSKNLILSSMSRSVASRASNASSVMLQELAARSQSRFFKSTGSFNDQQMRVIWNALGLYISRNLRMGRGVTIPKFGTFTFTPPEIRLKGVTNERQRDQKPRNPVFLIQKDFVKGLNLKTAIFYHQQFGKGLRPYGVYGSNGDVPITKMNLVQIASYANISKDATQTALNRILKYLGEKLVQGQSLNFQIPSVGALVSKGSLVAVRFNQHLNRQTRTILSKSLDERKQRGAMNLTSQNLKKLSDLSYMSMKLQNKPQEFFDIDEKTQKYLNETFGVNFVDSGMRRTLTGFDKTFTSKPFNPNYSQLRNSKLMKMSATQLFSGKNKNLNRNYNLALRLIKEWVYKNSLSSQKSFRDFCILAETNKEILLEDDVWKACKKINSDITEQQSQELFRLLDYNKDGFVTQDDWLKNINFDSNQVLRQLIGQIRRKQFTANKLLKIMGFQGTTKVNVFNLKQGLKKIYSKLSDQDSLSLSRYICKGRQNIEVQNILEVLNVTTKQNSGKQFNTILQVDKEWQENFLKRIKGKLFENGLYEDDLSDKFGFYDEKGSGYVDQAEFKNVLAGIGVPVSLNELIKIVRIFPINEKNQIYYPEFVARLQNIHDLTREQPLSQQKFTNTVLNILKQGTFLPFKIPITTLELTTFIQTHQLKQHSQKSILSFVKEIDINRDGLITNEDLKSYQNRHYNKEKSYEKLPDEKIHKLFVRLKEKSIKKKISYYDLFRKIDENSNGFITREEWIKNIANFLELNQNEKICMFEFMDRVQRINMVDYKTFLAFITSDSPHTVKLSNYQKFDWVEESLEKVKKWYESSKLALQDAFRVIDRDGDTYINENDLKNFLIEQVKINKKQITSVRLQKLIKMLDTFNKGRLNMLDWKTFLSTEKKTWIEDMKQQIGIYLSKKYNNLEEAYTQIAQGDHKLLFTTFEKWITQQKIFSAFMSNTDILKHLYSALDHHKKGYLLENDFVGSFGSFKWKGQLIKQFIEELKSKFKTSDEAWKAMISYKKNGCLTQVAFENSAKNVFGKRFSSNDLKNIWRQISSSRTQMTEHQFKQKYGSEWKHNINVVQKTFPKDSWLYRDFSIIKGTQTRNSQYSYTQKQEMLVQSEKIIQNLKDMLSTSPKTLQQAFKEVDSQDKGQVTNLQFKNAFRKLNISLTAKQIDLLLNYCGYRGTGLINWKQFLKMTTIRPQKQMILNRLQPRLQHLSDLCHFYMVSPKDAYRKFNNLRTGYMAFQEFHKLVQTLYSKAQEKLPQYQVLKELYDYIDIRKDGQIDFQQFTQVFRNCTPPSLLMGTTPAKQQEMVSKIIGDHEENQIVRQQSVPLFKSSKNYEDFVHLVGRNRKFIQSQIQKVNNQSLVPYKVVQKILKAFLNKSGVKVEGKVLRNLLAFAMTGEKVDYRLMLNDFKERAEINVQHPLTKFY